MLQHLLRKIAKFSHWILKIRISFISPCTTTNMYAETIYICIKKKTSFAVLDSAHIQDFSVYPLLRHTPSILLKWRQKNLIYIFKRKFNTQFSCPAVSSCRVLSAVPYEKPLRREVWHFTGENFYFGFV